MLLLGTQSFIAERTMSEPFLVAVPLGLLRNEASSSGTTKHTAIWPGGSVSKCIYLGIELLHHVLAFSLVDVCHLWIASIPLQ